MENGRDSKSSLVLIADDDSSFLAAFGQMLEMRGLKTVPVGTHSEVLQQVGEQQFDLMTLDLDWENETGNGLDVLRQVQQVDPLLPVVIITGHGSIPTAVEATRMGAFDYIEKMQDREKTLLTIKNAIEVGRLKRENRSFLNEIRKKYEIIGNSAVMKTVRDHIAKAGPTDSVVLISGESGTGKELVARQIHYHSNRREKTFVSVDSGTLADTLAESELFGHRKGAFTGAVQDRKGLFEEAEGGTLFLDEITNASLSLQARLLHVIQEREFRRVGDNSVRRCDVRIIAASNQDLPKLIGENAFREDLFYRLKVIEIVLPPLRRRAEDIPLLVERFLKVKSQQCGSRPKRLTPEAVNMLVDYDWPGNVRELENTIERIVILSESEIVGPDEMKSILGSIWLQDDTPLRSLNDMTREFRRDCIIKAINLAQGKVARAAQILQIDRTHLYKLINEYELKDIQ